MQGGSATRMLLELQNTLVGCRVGSIEYVAERALPRILILNIGAEEVGKVLTVAGFGGKAVEAVAAL